MSNKTEDTTQSSNDESDTDNNKVPTTVHTFMQIENITIDTLSKSFHIELQLNLFWRIQSDINNYDYRGIEPDKENQPQVELMNAYGDNQKLYEQQLALVELNETKYFRKEVLIKSSINNPFNLSSFPFDVQNLRISIKSTNTSNVFTFQLP
eukprot:130970_1